MQFYLNCTDLLVLEYSLPGWLMFVLILALLVFQVVIGPATVGGIQAGAFKIGETAGTIDNIIACKLYRSGSVGFVSKSVCIHSISPLSS